MTSIQISLTVLFIIAGVFQTLGANKLRGLVRDLYPDEVGNGFRPSRRILKRIEKENKDDKEVINKLRIGRTLEIISLLTFMTFLAVFFTGLL